MVRDLSPQGQSVSVVSGDLQRGEPLDVVSARTYRSEGKLLVRTGRENTGADSTVSFAEQQMVSPVPPREEELNTVAEILSSRGILQKVVDALGPSVVLGLEPVASNAGNSRLHVRPAGAVAGEARSHESADGTSRASP